MTMPASGPLNMGGTSSPVSVAQELGLGLTTTISMNDAAVRTLAAVGGSGTTWSMNSLYGKSNRVTSNITISANTQNYVLNTAKVTGYSAGKTDVTLTINSGIYVGSSTTGGIGLDVDTSWAAGDTVTIINNGFIVGCGGAGGAGQTISYKTVSGGSAGASGGPALRVQRATTITNNNVIGGGGGGGGGASGQYKGSDDTGSNYGGCGGGGGQGYNGGGGGGGGTAVGGPGGSISGNPGGSGGTGGPGGGGTGPNTYNIAGAAGGGWGASGGSTSAFGGGGGGACTTSGSNANITWAATGTRYGSIG